MIGRLEKTVLDCPDPRALAAFHAEILGWRINEDTDGAWVVIGRDTGGRELAFQRELSQGNFAEFLGERVPEAGRTS